MDEVIELAGQLNKQINQTSEAKEYLKYKTLYENDSELEALRKQIALLTKENKIKQKDELIAKFNSHPIVVNYNVAKEELLKLLSTIKNIIE